MVWIDIHPYFFGMKKNEKIDQYAPARREQLFGAILTVQNSS